MSPSPPRPRKRRPKRIVPKFRQNDLKRALKAAADAGLQVARVEVGPDGNIVIATATDAPQATLTPFQEWKAKRARQA